MNGSCDKCKSNVRSTQQILGFMICTQCAEELRRMVSRWVNATSGPVSNGPSYPVAKETSKRKSSR
jgi:hypothetical protein